MLVIRSAQIECLRDSARQQFAELLVEHSQRCFPAQCQHAGTAAVAATVDLALRQAQAAGHTTRGPVALYLNLMWMLGSHFESDPRNAALFKGRRNVKGSSAVGENGLLKVTARANEALDLIHGPDNARLARLLVRVCDLDIGALPARDGVSAWLGYLGPGYAEQDASAIAQAERAAAAVCAQWQLEGDGVHAVVALYTLILGSEFDRDPQFPWVRPVLDARNDAAPGLLAEARRYAQALLQVPGV